MDALADSFTSRLTTFAKDEVEKALDAVLNTLMHERAYHNSRRVTALENAQDAEADQHMMVSASISTMETCVRALMEGNKP